MREAVKEFPTSPVVDDLPPVAAEAIQYSRRSTQVPASADSAEIVSNMICIIMSAQWAPFCDISAISSNALGGISRLDYLMIFYRVSEEEG